MVSATLPAMRLALSGTLTCNRPERSALRRRVLVPENPTTLTVAGEEGL
jgi:hypothetical protein